MFNFVVYQIEIAGKYQIGSTGNLKSRMYSHLYNLKKGTHSNLKMQNRYNKYKDFSYTVLFEFDNREDAYVKEQDLLNLYFNKENYLMGNPNATRPPVKKGDSNGMFNCGYKLVGLNNGMYGKNHTNESLQKMKDSWTTERLEVAKQRISGDNNPSKRDDVKKKISDSRLGNKNVMKRPEVKNKMVQSNKKAREIKKLNGIPAYKIVKCTYCEKIGSAHNMSRYHFENCKTKNLINKY